MQSGACTTTATCCITPPCSGSGFLTGPASVAGTGGACEWPPADHGCSGARVLTHLSTTNRASALCTRQQAASRYKLPSEQAVMSAPARRATGANLETNAGLHGPPACFPAIAGSFPSASRPAGSAGAGNAVISHFASVSGTDGRSQKSRCQARCQQSVHVRGSPLAAAATACCLLPSPQLCAACPARHKHAVRSMVTRC